MSDIRFFCTCLISFQFPQYLAESLRESRLERPARKISKSLRIFCVRCELQSCRVQQLGRKPEAFAHISVYPARGPVRILTVAGQRVSGAGQMRSYLMGPSRQELCLAERGAEAVSESEHLERPDDCRYLLQVRGPVPASELSDRDLVRGSILRQTACKMQHFSYLSAGQSQVELTDFVFSDHAGQLAKGSRRLAEQNDAGGVEPLIKSNWGQEMPYYLQCPVYQNEYCVVGCVEPLACSSEWAQPGGTGTESYMNLVNCLLLAINDGTNPFRFPGAPERIACPVLLTAADKDFSVMPEPQKKFIARVPKGRYMFFRNSRHEIFRSTNDVLFPWWHEVLSFFRNPC